MGNKPKSLASSSKTTKPFTRTGFFFISCVLLIAVNTLLSAWFVLHNDLNFGTDIARDFLLLHDTVISQKPPLIGPKSGGIQGLFHGPLWEYINLPAFILGKGNPVVVGWFWVLLSTIMAGSLYFVGKNLFNRTTGIVSAVLLSAYLIPQTNQFGNPTGAVLLSPIFFYFLCKYILKRNYLHLLAGLFVIGCIIQFQVAFGGPLLILTTIYLMSSFIKYKNYSHITAFFILLLPLSTYIIFDLRHNFIQLHSVLNAFTSPVNSHNVPFSELLSNRASAFIDTLATSYFIPLYAKLLVIAVIVFAYIQAFKKKASPYKAVYMFFGYLYIFYFPLSFFLNGDIQSYHVSPFVPLVILIIASALRFLDKRIFGILLIILLFHLEFIGYNQSVLLYNSFDKTNTGSWKFNSTMAQRIFQDAGTDFGYYINTPDELGYSPRYAMEYAAKDYPFKAYAYEKRPLTYLIINPADTDKSGVTNHWWRDNKVKLTKEPVKTIGYPNNMRVEKYILSPKDTSIPADPNLINGIFFR